MKYHNCGACFQNVGFLRSGIDFDMKYHIWHDFRTSTSFKGQLQRFHKLSLFDIFRHIENGFDINF